MTTICSPKQYAKNNIRVVLVAKTALVIDINNLSNGDNLEFILFLFSHSKLLNWMQFRFIALLVWITFYVSIWSWIQKFSS